MSRLHMSPLGAELDAARDDGTRHVVDLVRRRRAVRATRLADELTDAPPVDGEAVRAAATARAEREMWWLSDMEGGDG